MMKIFSTITWLILCISLLLFSLGISWQINKNVNFTYPLWYQVLDISAHIKEYAPQNKFQKQDFVHTDKHQHYELFEQVVVAINDHGENLNKITYHSKNKHQRLFTPSEVIHLQDVSTLIDTLRLIWLINLLPLIVLSLLYTRKIIRLPSINLKIQALVAGITLVISSLAIFGFNNIFYALHTAIFPDNHQWFFYYQESLMSTFMKAPDLFAAIAINLMMVGGVIFSFSYYMIEKKVNRKSF